MFSIWTRGIYNTCYQCTDMLDLRKTPQLHYKKILQHTYFLIFGKSLKMFELQF